VTRCVALDGLPRDRIAGDYLTMRAQRAQGAPPARPRSTRSSLRARAADPSPQRSGCAVAQPVERDADEVVRLPGSLVGTLAMPTTIWMTSPMLTSGRTTPASWARVSSGSPAVKSEVRQTWNSGASVLEVVQELVGERALRADVGDEALEPAVERLPRIAPSSSSAAATDLRDLVDVQRLQQRLAVGEVPVQRPDPDPGAARDLLERRRLAALGERLAAAASTFS
jgi:hypothetical protein